jgi:hypothetical protein
MDLEKYLRDTVDAQRANDLKTSDQMTLRELIISLEAISDKTLPVYFDNGKHWPNELDSWRGVYAELALEYDQTPEAPNVQVLLDELKSAVGKTFTGYKGGDFTMGNHSPVWVANYGNSQSFDPDEEHDERYIVDVVETPKAVSLITYLTNY